MAYQILCGDSVELLKTIDKNVDFTFLDPPFILNKKWFASWEYENSKKLAFLILACIARYVQKMPIFSA